MQKRNIAGAAHGAKAEVEIREEFSSDWERLSFESEKLLAQFIGRVEELPDETKAFPEGKTRETIIRTRINQGFFGQPF